MRICFYAPFKPLGHPNPSGDLIIATGLYDFLLSQGHQILIASSLRSRWIYLKPWHFFTLLKERMATAKRIRKFSPDLWLTYHCYYKAPDLLGPPLCKKFDIPYCVFQGIYSTKQRRSLKGKAGFYLNRQSLLQAIHLFSNRKMDLENLRRIISPGKLTYIKPGIFPESFCFDQSSRESMHHSWQIKNEPVILSAAMFRPDVKTQGLIWMIKALARLTEEKIPFKLVIAGDGSERKKLLQLADQYIPNRVVFAGQIKREEMYKFYSGGDIFVFPGIRESLGMVYLEAQSCGLPVVAFDNGGIPEVVQQGKTAYLAKLFDEDSFCTHIKQLLQHTQQRMTMGQAAAKYIRQNHDLQSNYLELEDILTSHAKTS